MSLALAVLLSVQVVTFLCLGVIFLTDGQWRLGLSQLLLATVQALIYSGRME